MRMIIQNRITSKEVIIAMSAILGVMTSVVTSDHVVNIIAKVLIVLLIEELLIILLYYRDKIAEKIKHNKLLCVLTSLMVFILGCRLNSFIPKTYVSNYSREVYRLLLLMGIVAFTTALFLIFAVEAKIHIVFAFLAGMVGLIFMLVFPVGQVPDEVFHAQCAYRISNKMLGLDDINPKIGYYERQTELDYPKLTITVGEYQRDWFWSELGKKTSDTDIVVAKDIIIGSVPWEYTYYIPALGISLGRVIGLNASTTYLLGRMFNFIFYIAVATFIMWRIPLGKELLFTILMFPVSIQQTMSCSYDMIVILLSLLVISEALHLVIDKDELNMRGIIRGIAIMVIAFALLFPIKYHAYFALGLMLLYVWMHYKNINESKVLKCIRVLIIAGVIVTVGAFAIAQIYPLSENPAYVNWARENAYSIGYIINNPKNTVMVIANTVNAYWFGYYSMMISGPLGWVNVGIDNSVLVGETVLLLICIVGFPKNVVERISKVDRIVWLIIFGICMLCIICGMWLQWTPVSHNVIKGVQGRYFTPIVILPMLALAASKIKFRNECMKFVPVVSIFFAIIAYTSVI